MSGVRRGAWLAAVWIAMTGCGDEDTNKTTASVFAEGDGDMPGDGDMAGDGNMMTPSPAAMMPSGDGDMMEPGSPYNGVPSEVADGEILPIVFVHGYVGSAQQYESQAMRWEMNGYPRDLIYAMDHDGAGRMIDAYAAQLVEFIDNILTEHPEYEKVYLVGHSRGTLTSSTFLMKDENRAKVAKYIAIDGGPCPMTIACVAPTRAVFKGQAHVEVATSKESFKLQYEFIMGEEPKVIDIVPEDGMVTLSGRVLQFPDNIGAEGATFQLWEIDPATGQRVTTEPHASFEIDATGDFGPVDVDPTKHYEQHLFRATGGTEQHVYGQRFVRSSRLMRVLTQDPEMSDIRDNSNLGPDHVTVIAMRMREWFETDVLEVSTESSAGNQDPVDAIDGKLGGTAEDGLGMALIALYLHDDAATPKETTRELLPYFPMQPFQSGVDVYMPAEADASGTVTLTNYPRGDMDDPQTLRFPNWPSDTHSVTAFFADYPID